MEKLIKHALLSPVLYRVVRWGLGILFFYSGATKLFHPRAFAEVIQAFGLVPPGSEGYAALIISLAEVVIGVGLIADLKGFLGAYLGMLLVFMGVLAYGISMGFDIDCGCFGNDDPVGEMFHGLKSAMVRDFGLLFAVAYLYVWRFCHHKRFKIYEKPSVQYE